MEKVDRNRRRILQAAALLAGSSAPFAFSPAARAWDIVPLEPGSSAGAAYADRCGGDPEHRLLSEKLKAELAGNPSMASLSAQCPLCRCPIVVSR